MIWGVNEDINSHVNTVFFMLGIIINAFKKQSENMVGPLIDIMITKVRDI